MLYQDSLAINISLNILQISKLIKWHRIYLDAKQWKRFKKLLMKLYIILITSAIRISATIIIAFSCFEDSPMSSSYSIKTRLKETLNVIKKLNMNRLIQIQKVLNLKRRLKTIVIKAYTQSVKANN